jgi:hypothetical protein
VLAEGKATTFGEQVSRQFSKDAYKEGFRKTTKHAFDLLDRVGPKATAQTFFKDGLKPFAEGSPGMALNWGGLIVGGAAPPVVTGHDPSNLFGWKSVRRHGVPQEGPGCARSADQTSTRDELPHPFWGDTSFSWATAASRGHG